MTTPPGRGVLWDLDGTLVDSRDYHWDAWRDTLAAEGRPISFEQFAPTFGLRNDAAIRALLGDGVDAATIERIGTDKEERYRAALRAGGLVTLEGVDAWVQRLHADGWRQAIASSAPRANLAAIAGVLRIAPLFQALVSAEEVERGKPAPDLFLRAAERLGLPPARCVVVEDAEAGVAAAHAAGMPAIGVGSAHAHLGADLSAASLADLPADAFERLLGATR